MGDVTVQGFSLTPDEERFFVRFLRRRALPWSAAVGVLAGGLTAGVLTCSLAPDPTSFGFESEHGVPGLAAPLADEQARTELAALRKELEALRARPASAASAAAPAEDDARVAELRRSVDGIKRELQTIATSVTELQRRTTGGSAPAAADGASAAEVEPLRARVFNVEARQDREEAARLEWAGNVEQRVRNLELARRARETDEQAALQGLFDRLHAVEQTLATRP
jgi:hypothetical protein